MILKMCKENTIYREAAREILGKMIDPLFMFQTSFPFYKLDIKDFCYKVKDFQHEAKNEVEMSVLEKVFTEPEWQNQFNSVSPVYRLL